MAKEEKAEAVGKPAEIADWLLEIEERLGELQFGHILVKVYNRRIVGISVTHDIKHPGGQGEQPAS